MGAEHMVKLFVPALAEQVQIRLAESRRKAVRIVRDGRPVVALARSTLYWRA